MPIGALKNCIYRAALPVLGRRCQWSAPQWEAQAPGVFQHLARVLKRHYVVGTAIQVVRQGKLAECYTTGNARLAPEQAAVRAGTLFRTASIAKFATALLVFRLQTLGKLDVSEDISDFLQYSVRNPRYPEIPITLGMLMSHSSSIIDSPAYFAALHKGADLSRLLQDSQAFAQRAPGAAFQYSNLAAGMIACLLEARFGVSFEALAQAYLFEPQGACATFDLAAVGEASIANSYRVLPSGKEPAFDARRRCRAAMPLLEPDAERHYLLASGGLLITAESLARLMLLCLETEPSFLDAKSLQQMKTPLGQWPEKEVCMRHGMGLLSINDGKISQRVLYGHQGFAYGAVNGCFFTGDGDGFVSLNSGASEARFGHISLLNRDLIRIFLGDEKRK